MAKAKMGEVPKIKFNGIQLDELLGNSFEVTIIKNVRRADEIIIKAYGEIKPDEVDTNFVYLQVFNPHDDKKTDGKKYRLMEVKEGSERKESD